LEFDSQHLAGCLPALQGDAASVMSAHVIVEALDSEPTTLSAPVMTDLLREQLGFEGVTISDALEMQGVLDRTGSLPAAAVGALAAGVDLLCLGAVQYEQATRECVDAVVAAVDDGVLTMARLQEVNRRVQQLAAKFAPGGEVPGVEEERRAGLAAARRAATAEGDAGGLGASVVGLDDRTSIAAGPVPWGSARELKLLNWEGSVKSVGPGQ